MATPNYEQIQSFSNVKSQLIQAAFDEFMEYVYEGMTTDEVIDAATNVAMKFSNLGCELGAQWYDLCSELAGLDVEPAYLPEVNAADIHAHARAVVGKAPEGSPVEAVMNNFLQNIIQNSVRDTGDANLWRDYERGMAGGRWARVPVGDTCAWCLMLASQGAWYLSEESALGKEAGHYHSDCNCTAVYHADPDSIAGYSALKKYKGMYYDAENARSANASKRTPYPDELKYRVDHAKELHEKKYQEYLEALERGENPKEVKPWTKYNETLIVMRYQNPGLH